MSQINLIINDSMILTNKSKLESLQLLTDISTEENYFLQDKCTSLTNHNDILIKKEKRQIYTITELQGIYNNKIETLILIIDNQLLIL
mgnify:CR=1 FL=1